MPKKLDLTGQKFFDLTAIEPTSKRSDQGAVIWKCKCSCGKYVYASTTKLRQGKIKSCEFCKNKYFKEKSYGEEIIKMLLINNNIHYIREFKFQDCKDIQSLKFDFAIFDNDQNLLYLIEYDGSQHFKSSQRSNLEDKHKKDLIKNEYCFEHNIPLIRIPYSHKNIDINDILIETSNFIINKNNMEEYYCQNSKNFTEQKKIIPYLKIKRISDKNLYKNISKQLNIKIQSFYNFLSGAYTLSDDNYERLLQLLDK